MILLAFTHGLRPGEVCALQWQQVDLKRARLHVRRQKGGLDSVHPLRGSELRALRQLRREWEWSDFPYVFPTERGGPMSTAGYRTMLARAGRGARIPFRVHPQMLRHSCGYKLANDKQDTRAIQAYMGHVNIQHTARYTALRSDRFRDFWRD